MIYSFFNLHIILVHINAFFLKGYKNILASISKLTFNNSNNSLRSQIQAKFLVIMKCAY